MKAILASMKSQFTTLHHGSRTCAMTELVPGRKPVLGVLMRLLWACALVLTGFGAKAAVVFTTLHVFAGTNDGANPRAALVQGSNGYFYGTTENGGRHGDGTVFQISTNGALTILYSFSGTNDGANPYAALAQGSDGYFYGTTGDGGTSGLGTVFKISTNGLLTSLYSFTGGHDGANPDAGLVLGSDGSFYGTTDGGGTNGFGTVFKISTNGVLTTLYAFGTVTNANGRPLDGWLPIAGLVQGSDGYLYGTTFLGGTNNVSDYGGGTVFKISTAGALTSLYSFGGEGYGAVYPGGASPEAGLVQSSDGNFYGTTAFNYMGINQGHDNGAVFKINTNGAVTSLYLFSLSGTDDGSHPVAGLVQDNDGNFYGTTGSGGIGFPGGGTIFRLTIVPEFQAVTLTNSLLSLTWSTEAGSRYQLQYNSELNSTNWINLNSPATGTGATLSTTDSPTNGPHRFYRLVLLR